MLTPLPIDPLLGEITAAVQRNPNVILTATPGAGKTTRLPPELLNSVEGKILVLQPRRMAAVAAAHRIASERGWLIGKEVGYQVRFDSKVSASTRLIFMTDALALRRLVSDPELNGVGLVVIDEFHERNLNQDLMLGCLRELQELGSGVKILVMSATLDTDRLARFLPDSQVIDVPGKVFPLEIEYSNQSWNLRTDFEFYDRMTSAVFEAAGRSAGDILVFMPGTGEINRLRDRLEEKGIKREIQILHGSLPLQEQQRVLRKSEAPRVILSTNVAEASVTVDGVDSVIDCGLAKVMDTNFKTGFSQLNLTRISQFNARQRAGRAARQKEGVCWRLWTPHEEVTQAVEPVPECRRADLSQTLLLLSHLGVTDFGSFSWFDPPPGALLMMAQKSLRWMGALDSDNRLTELGKRLIDFPLPPRWGALLAMGEDRNAGDLSARMVALLNERDLLSDARGAPTTRLECDLSLRLELLEDFEQGKARHLRAQPVVEAAQQLAGLVKKGTAKEDPVLIRKLVLHSQRDRLCRRRGGGERALMVGGRGVKLSPDSQVRNSEFFVALSGVDLPGQPDTTISVACGLSKEFLLSELKDEIQVREDIHFDETKGNFYARRGRFIDGLPIEEPSLTPVDPAKIGSRLVDILVDKWDWFTEQHEGLKEWMQRWRFAGQHDPKYELPDEKIREFIEMAAFQKTSIKAVLDQDLPGLLESVLDRALIREFREQVPAALAAPSGFRHKIDYSESHAAYVEVRLQEMFGLNTHPKILNGKVPLTFRLLGPNFRPTAVTSDIPGFWKGAYADVRKELRARYPKHSWPDDPVTAKPEAKGRKRQ